jgi:hypothetical protein
MYYPRQIERATTELQLYKTITLKAVPNIYLPLSAKLQDAWVVNRVSTEETYTARDVVGVTVRRWRCKTLMILPFTDKTNVRLII